ncbi:hypothetical protein ElyMa_005886400 [Elysia marginata]|uniref:Uncharacterized protein n=1 Tax=Elysia marginata TaxID=1093978 RepID=A0AAV4G3C0_9GAST|nr:hypothetical protein ElyMa_005886400 [Elysia marginata]
MDTPPPFIKDMCVYHRCIHIGVAKQFLHGANIVTAFQQVGGKTVTEGMAAGVLMNAGLVNRLPDSFLNTAWLDRVAPSVTRHRIQRFDKAQACTVHQENGKQRRALQMRNDVGRFLSGKYNRQTFLTFGRNPLINHKTTFPRFSGHPNH